MHEQNFEKQVQQKMEELSLTPSAPVWQKVEEQIRKKKDRRRLIFWLLPLLLVVGGGAGWIIWSTGEGAAPSDTVQVTKQPEVPSTTVQQAAPATTTSPDKTNKTHNTTASQTSINGTSEPPINKQSRVTAKEPKLTALFKKQQEAAPAKTEILPASNEVAIKEQEALEVNKETTSQEAVPVNKQVTVNSEEKNRIHPIAADTTVASSREDVVSKLPDAPLPVAPVTISSSPAPDSGTLTEKAPVKKARPSRWQWTAHAEAGIVGVRSNLFELPSTRSQDMYSSPTQFSGGNFFAYYPSPQEEGPAFAAGFTAKRILSSRAKLTAGVQYNYYTTTMAVGQEKNATTTAMVPYARQSLAADNSYLPGTQNNYRNRYHFIQLPIGIEYQIFRRIPLQVHGGVSVAHLVSTNALWYDYNAQAYYQNSSAFNATQLHLFTDLTYPVWKRKAVRLDVGPYIQYSLTELQKTAADKNRLFSTGLRTQFSF